MSLLYTVFAFSLVILTCIGMVVASFWGLYRTFVKCRTWRRISTYLSIWVGSIIAIVLLSVLGLEERTIEDQSQLSEVEQMFLDILPFALAYVVLVALSIGVFDELLRTLGLLDKDEK